MSAAPHAVFLSYASQDADEARKIADALRGAGVEVWFDQSELRGGDSWDAKIRKQIKECALFVPIISTNTQARAEGYFRREWKLAADRTHDMADHVAFLVPIVIDKTKDAEAFVPEKFREVQWTRHTDAESMEAFCLRIHGLLHAGDRVAAISSPVAADREVWVDLSNPVARGLRPRRRVTSWGVAGALLAVLCVAGGALLYREWRRTAVERRLHDVTIPEIDRRITKGDIGGAFALTAEAEQVAPTDPALRQRWSKVALDLAIESQPPGAAVYVKPYYDPKAEWRPLGQTPLARVRLPQVYTRWRVEKEGFSPLDVQRQAVDGKVTFKLHSPSAVPADMVWVNGGTVSPNSTGLRALRLDDYLIDRFEVTNRQFKQFVDAGGYAKPELWRQPFVKAGRTLTREEAMGEFRDSTGRPGPAAWKNGAFAEGAAELPVAGVSWFEAAAYAEWSGKRLPSVYHWRFAARPVADQESIVPLSNFSGRSLAAVGTYQGVSACGAYDMAGNVKEWCWNAAAPDVRFLLGGAWREPDYMFVQSDALSPFDRSDSNGFRCIKFAGPEPAPAEVDAAVEQRSRDFAKEQPVSDEVFAAIRSMYAYDKRPLDARLENTDDADPRWRKEKVSYRAAYGDERIFANPNRSPAPPTRGWISISDW